MMDGMDRTDFGALAARASAAAAVADATAADILVVTCFAAADDMIYIFCLVVMGGKDCIL
jgi:hypothetical protein